jgi:D-alanyl-lipoteichoic acid acyltransferase DltB (MBOAT superfamily)
MFFLYSGFVLENLAILLFGLSLMVTLVLLINHRRQAIRYAMAGNMVTMALVLISFSSYTGSLSLPAVKQGATEVKKAWYNPEQPLEAGVKTTESKVLFKIVYSLYSYLSGQ